MAFRLLALAVPDPMKTEITIASPERSIMECLWVLEVFSVNAGKVINTRREVMEEISLMLLKSLIRCVHPRPHGIKARFPGFFTFFREVYFPLTGNTKASDLKGYQSFLSFVNVCLSLIFSLL